MLSSPELPQVCLESCLAERSRAVCQRLRESDRKDDWPPNHEKRLPLLGFWLPHIFAIFIVVVGYLGYMYTKPLVFSDFQTTGVNNSWRVITFESDLGISWEPVMQAWAIDSAKALVVFFNWAYIVTFWPL